MEIRILELGNNTQRETIDFCNTFIKVIHIFNTSSYSITNTKVGAYTKRDIRLCLTKRR